MDGKMRIELEITDFSYGGSALGRMPDGRAVFIPFTMPGERVRVRIPSEFKDYCTGQLEEVLRPAPERITPRCRHFAVCGGCHYQHLVYQQQLQVKQKIVADQMRRIGKISTPEINDIIPSPKKWHYRNTMQFHISDNGRPGFRAGDSAEVVEVGECHLPVDEVGALWPLLEVDPASGIRRVLLRAGSDGELLAGLESEQDLPPEFSLDFPLSVHFLGSGGNYLMAGDAHNVMTVNGVNFLVSPRSFFQVNLAQAGRIVDHILANAEITAEDVAFDLYSGAGLFSAFLAPRIKEVIAVEASESACNDFAVNLDAHENVSLYIGSVEQILPKLKAKPDLVLVDPPRAGLAKGVVECLIKSSASQLVYISCDPATLARDCRRLVEGGFVIRSIQPFDLFPQTYHIECIVILERSVKT